MLKSEKRKNLRAIFSPLYSPMLFIYSIVFQVALRGFLVILALSLHAIFEGMAVGLTQKVRTSVRRCGRTYY